MPSHISLVAEEKLSAMVLIIAPQRRSQQDRANRETASFWLELADRTDCRE
jgi:hypothetical protein